MPRYKYHDDWLVSAQWDCNFWKRCSTLEEALAVAEPKRTRNPHIAVHADCTYDGISNVAHVGLTLRETDGKSIVEIWELFDKEVDEYIQCRVTTGHWGHDFASQSGP